MFHNLLNPQQQQPRGTTTPYQMSLYRSGRSQRQPQLKSQPQQLYMEPHPQFDQDDDATDDDVTDVDVDEESKFSEKEFKYIF